VIGSGSGSYPGGMVEEKPESRGICVETTRDSPQWKEHSARSSHLQKNGLADSIELDLSIVIPCLNESETLEYCVRRAQKALASLGIRGEVIVADNGSSDDSIAIAETSGARVVRVERKGYGSALMGGIDAARGRFILIGDADRSYDFCEIDSLFQKMNEGYDLVLGNRFKGGIRPGAMPWLHRIIGNPLLTKALNVFYGAPIGDAHCGMRAFSRSAYDRMGLRTTGMEFASEMIVKAALAGLRLCEVPVSYSPDGRTRPSHLRSFRDGWRHLRFLLIYSPRWLFVVPGIVLLALGLSLDAVLFPGPVHIGRVVFDVHMMLLGTLLALLGFQILYVGAFAKVFAVGETMLPPDPIFERVSSSFTLERGLAIGSITVLAGLALLVKLAVKWIHVNLGPLELDITMRSAILGMMLVVLGVQTVFASFFLGMLGFGEASSSFSMRKLQNRSPHVPSEISSRQANPNLR
jgi:hypothetical protein